MTAESTAEASSALQMGFAMHSQGRLEEATALYHQVLRSQPMHFDAWHSLGLAAFQMNRPKLALDLFAQALLIDPRSEIAHNHRGNALLALGRRHQAIDSYDRAISLKPEYAEAHYNRGNAWFDLQHYREAIDSYDRAVSLKSDYALAYGNRGLALLHCGRQDEAIVEINRAIAIDPRNAELFNSRGLALRELAQFDAAIDSYDAAIALKADFAEAHCGRGNAQAALQNYDAAAESYRRAIAIKEDFAEAHLNLGNVHKDLRRWQQASECYDQAIRFSPDLAEAYFLRGNIHRSFARYEAAIADFDRAMALKPQIKFLRGLRRHLKMQIGDWTAFDEDLADIVARVETGEPASPPFAILALSSSGVLQRRAAEIWAREECPPDDSLPPISRPAPSDKIRVGYFSADFRNHPVSYLTAELFELHDRSQFQISAFSLGPNTQDAMRLRLEGAFDQFIDVAGHSNRDIALLARSMNLDIAVDLGGFTEETRSGVFALRTAPVQISYIGYLGTMAVPYIDYLIADAVIIPPEYRRHYAEKIIYLPTYQANDGKRRMADETLSREQLGLPSDAFVYCCFNTSYKILPEIFSSWMRILRTVPQSVLFLHADGEAVKRNLCREAQQRGVDPARLVFGARLPMPDYLARYRVADLFLDTNPYNAGATASDALWAGLPVLTCIGETFSSRMAASLLTAIGLPDLITTSLPQYEALAVELALNPSLLADIKRRLRANKRTYPLFDSSRFARRLEAVYRTIHERSMSGNAPTHTFADTL